jgi:hypothetical protein
MMPEKKLEIDKLHCELEDAIEFLIEAQYEDCGPAIAKGKAWRRRVERKIQKWNEENLR